MTTNTTETAEIEEYGLDAITSFRRVAHREVNDHYEQVTEPLYKALNETFVEIGRGIIYGGPHDNARFRELCDKGREQEEEVSGLEVERRCKIEEVDDKYDQLTVEHFAKNPIATNPS